MPLATRTQERWWSGAKWHLVAVVGSASGERFRGRSNQKRLQGAIRTDVLEPGTVDRWGLSGGVWVS